MKDLFTASYCFPWRICDWGIKVFTNGGEAAESGGRWPWDHVGSHVKCELGRDLFCESQQSFDGKCGQPLPALVYIPPSFRLCAMDQRRASPHEGPISPG